MHFIPKKHTLAGNKSTRGDDLKLGKLGVVSLLIHNFIVLPKMIFRYNPRLNWSQYFQKRQYNVYIVDSYSCQLVFGGSLPAGASDTL